MRTHRWWLVSRLALGWLLAWLALPSLPSLAQDVTRGRPLAISPAAGEIEVDGELSDPGWRGVEAVDGWYETNPGDNVEAPVANRARLAYDGEFLYAAFEFEDPEPETIRAPLGDRDYVPSHTDYGGLILDTLNDGRTAMMFLANPRGVQYDALTSDASGEDSSPDFFWDAAARVTDGGWVLEMRIPFSTLRYTGSEPEMGVLLYRNWPRDFRTQMFAGPLPREEDCFICHSHPLSGFRDLPNGGSLVIAPYATADQEALPRGGTVGAGLESGSAGGDGGLDVKWVPSPALAVDATLNPDFSQIESDVPQLSTNERFALFFPEKRPFFLEGVDLFSTPINAVYTRSVTEPDWGARATGRLGETAYTLLVSDDRGGGSVIIPGVTGSSLARQDFASTVAMTRVRHDLGDSFVSVLAVDRRTEDGAYNRVGGPDFRWRPTPQDTITGQLLFSASRTPERPDLADEWDGRKLSGHAGRLWWFHGDGTVDWFLSYEDVADDFRADSGFVPQVGIRESFAEAGRTFRPEDGPVRRLRTFLFSEYTTDRDGELVFQGVSPGFGLDGRWNSFLRFNVGFDKVRSGDELFSVQRLFYTVRFSPGQRISRVELFGDVGDQVDFANHRPGSGATVSLRTSLRPTDHLELQLQGDRRWLDVDESDARGRLFTADLARLRAQYTFSARSYLRLIGEWAEVERDPALYDPDLHDDVERRSGGFGGSALFAYKLNWQTVLFVGYADQRELVPDGDGHTLEESGRRVFLKLGYAFQR